jgi:hypothetical protein
MPLFRNQAFFTACSIAIRMSFYLAQVGELVSPSIVRSSEQSRCEFQGLFLESVMVVPKVRFIATFRAADFSNPDS